MQRSDGVQRTCRITGGLLCLLGAALIGSCSGDSPTGPSVGPPAVLLIEGGQDQSAVVGAELTTALTAKVVDANGRPVRGQAVNFRIVSGGGSVFAGVAITSDSGIARERWTLGTSVADSQRVEARAVDATGNAIVFGVFRATARPDVPASVLKVAGDSQTVVVGTPASDSLTVRVVDRFGNPVPQATVRWVVMSGGGSIGSDSTVTNALGVARTSWVVGHQVGADQRVAATVGSLAVQTFQATVQAAAAVGIAVVTPAAGAASGAPFTIAPRVRLVDAFNNTAAGSLNAIALSVSTGGTLMGSTTVTPTAGEATFTGTGLSGVVGEYTLTYSAAALPATTHTLVLGAGAPTQLVVTTQPAGATSGAAFSTQPVVELRDNAGNRTTSTTTVTAAIASGGGRLQGAGAVAADSGVARFANLRIDLATAHTLSFAVTSPALSVTAEPVTVVPGAPTQLATVTAAAGATSGVAFTTQPVVEIRDAAGNRTTSTAAATVAVSTGATLVGTVSATAVAGRATFTDVGVSGLVGDYTLTFSASGQSAVTQSITLSAGSATQLALITSAAGAASGVAFTTQPVVEIRDAAGNRTASSEVVTITVSAGGTISGTATMRAAAGRATFTNVGVSGLVGVYTLTFTATGQSTATQSVIVDPGVPYRAILTTQPAGAVAGAAFATQPVVELRDRAGNRATSTATVIAAIQSGSGLLQGTAAVSMSDGIAHFTNLRIDLAEAHTLRFSITIPALGVVVVMDVAAVVTVAPGAASQLFVTTQPSGAVSGAAFTTQPVVELRDAQGNRTTSTAIVTASVASGGGTLVGTAAVAAVNGMASFTDLRIDLAVEHALQFQMAGPISLNSSLFTVSPGAATQLAVVTPAAGAASGAVFTTQPVVEIQDAAGNRTTSTQGVRLISSTGGTLLGGTQLVAVNGRATFAGVGLSGAAGDYTLTYEAPDITATSQVVTLAAGSPTELLYQAVPTGAVSGSPLAVQPVLMLRDAAGNVSPNATQVVASIANDTTTLFGARTVSAVNGVARFTDLRIDRAGTFTLSFAAPALNLTAPPAPITVSAGTANRYLVTASTTAAAAGGTVTITAELADVNGNAVATNGKTVTWSKSNANGSFASATSTTNGSGIATVIFTSDTVAGTTTTVTATDGDALTGTTATITTVAGPATFAILMDSATQVTRVSSTTSKRPGVRLSDAYGNRVQGVTVSFSVASGSGAVTGASVVSDVQGEARVGSWTMGAVSTTNSLTIQVPGFTDGTVFSRAVPNSAFPIDVRLLAGTSTQYQPLMNDAADRWRKAIINSASSVFISSSANSCFPGQPTISESTSGVIVYAEVKEIDGPGGTLAQAGTCLWRASDGLPAVGYMAFDVADLDAQVVAGSAFGTVVHEIGHVLRIGSGWDFWGLRQDVGTADPIFTGADARWAFDQIGGLSYSGRIVPLENTGGAGSRDVHWRESVMGRELMTPSILFGQTLQPFSAITLFALQDMGYGITGLGYDDYTVASNLMALREGGPQKYTEDLDFIRPRAIDDRTGVILDPAQQAQLELEMAKQFSSSAGSRTLPLPTPAIQPTLLNQKP